MKIPREICAFLRGYMPLQDRPMIITNRFKECLPSFASKLSKVPARHFAKCACDIITDLHMKPVWESLAEHFDVDRSELSPITCYLDLVGLSNDVQPLEVNSPFDDIC
jgi:hypothetical protein